MISVLQPRAHDIDSLQARCNFRSAVDHVLCVDKSSEEVVAFVFASASSHRPTSIPHTKQADSPPGVAIRMAKDLLPNIANIAQDNRSTQK